MMGGWSLVKFELNALCMEPLKLFIINGVHRYIESEWNVDRDFACFCMQHHNHIDFGKAKLGLCSRGICPIAVD